MVSLMTKCFFVQQDFPGMEDIRPSAQNESSVMSRKGTRDVCHPQPGVDSAHAHRLVSLAFQTRVQWKAVTTGLKLPLLFDLRVDKQRPEAAALHSGLRQYMAIIMQPGKMRRI